MVVDHEREDSTNRSHHPLFRDVFLEGSLDQASQAQAEPQRRNVLASQLAYWKQQLQGAPMILELPTDRPHSPVQMFVGAKHSFVLPQKLTTRLKTLSQREGVSLFVTLLAAFGTLLSRYSGQDDLLVGTPLMRDSQATPVNLPGSFANLVVLRTNVSGNPSFRDLLERVRQGVMEAQAHQHVPFEQIVQALLPEPEPDRHPLFQVMFVLDSAPLQAQEGNAFLPKESCAARCDLTLWLQETEQELRGWIEYNRALFDNTTIVRLVGHWQTLLEGIGADPEQRLSELPLLTEVERHQSLVEWNDTTTSYTQESCLHRLIEAQVEQTPDAVAMIFEDDCLTYQQLNSRANQLAHRLQALGVGPEVLVGICVERSLGMVIALLGILKAGGAYVPLDPTYPSERLAFMLEDAQVSVLVTQQSLLPHLPHKNTAVVCLDTDEAVLARQSMANPNSTVGPDHLAYVIYTSGSTGRPKGVQILQRAVVNFMLSMRQQPGLTAEDTLLAVTTLSFDIAALELFLPLIVGARLIIISRDVTTRGTALAETLARTGTTVMQATPITWRTLLASGWQGSEKLKALCGGEALPLELAQQLLSKVGSLYNMYGPTETTIWSSLSQITPDATSISIGRPIANTQLYVLDKQLQLVPVGVAGELYIGGDGLARGYLNRPELTAERFLRHPLRTEPGARVYKTGDLARYRADGTIELIGRIDFQVKIRGLRIELGEIEAVLRQHASVQDVVVVVREDIPGNKALVAYVVASDSGTGGDLRNYLKEKLPDYMVPTTFVLLEALPLTPNGKVDRRALPAPEYNKLQQDKDFVAPTLPIHHQLVQVWEELIDVRPIGIRDNFFELGGHSLLAVRLVDRIEQVFGKKIAAATLLAGPTIAQLADALSQTEETDNAPANQAGQVGNGKRASSRRGQLLSSLKTMWVKPNSSGRGRNSKSSDGDGK